MLKEKEKGVQASISAGCQASVRMEPPLLSKEPASRKKKKETVQGGLSDDP